MIQPEETETASNFMFTSIIIIKGTVCQVESCDLKFELILKRKSNVKYKYLSQSDSLKETKRREPNIFNAGGGGFFRQ